MKNDWIRLLMLVTLLVIGGALEEILPRIGPCGVPVLLGETICLSLGGRPMEMMLFAIMAGVVEESLSGLPMMSAVSGFVIASVLVHWIYRRMVVG